MTLSDYAKLCVSGNLDVCVCANVNNDRYRFHRVVHEIKQENIDDLKQLETININKLDYFATQDSDFLLNSTVKNKFITELHISDNSGCINTLKCLNEMPNLHKLTYSVGDVLLYIELLGREESNSIRLNIINTINSLKKVKNIIELCVILGRHNFELYNHIPIFNSPNLKSLDLDSLNDYDIIAKITKLNPTVMIKLHIYPLDIIQFGVKTGVITDTRYCAIYYPNKVICDIVHRFKKQNKLTCIIHNDIQKYCVSKYL
jgi:hypothetical protein